MSEFEFSYEKLDVYRCAIEFLSVAHALCDQLPIGYSHLSDQLRRACISIPLNIAEGSAKITLKDRMRFYGIARASALECSAVISCCSTLNLVESNSLISSRQMVYRIVQMLSKLTSQSRGR